MVPPGFRRVGRVYRVEDGLPKFDNIFHSDLISGTGIGLRIGISAYVY